MKIFKIIYTVISVTFQTLTGTLGKWETLNKDLQAVNKTLILLSNYHAQPMDNPQFLKQYRHLINMQTLLAKENPNV